MPSETKQRKRSLDESRETVKRKRICFEAFFKGNPTQEEILNSFYSNMKNLEGSDITLAKLKKITRSIRQLLGYNLERNLISGDILKTIKILVGFMKENMVQDLQQSHEDNFLKLKANAELAFEICLICLFAFVNTKLSESDDVDDHINDIIFFLRTYTDEIVSHLNKSKDSKRNAGAILNFKDSITENLGLSGELLRNRNLSSLNTTGLIASCIGLILHYGDSAVQTSALSVILSLYLKSEQFQALTLNLVFKSIGKCSEYYKFTKNYKIRRDSSVSMFTVMMMSLIENVPVCVVCDDSAGTDGTSLRMSQRFLRESFESVMKTACFVIMTFVKMGGEGEDYKTYISFFVQFALELIDASNEPEWPSTRFVLNLVAKPLTELLTLKPATSIQLRKSAIRILCEIVKKKIRDKNRFSSVLESLIRRFNDLESGTSFVQFSRRILLDHLNRQQKTGINDYSAHLYAVQWYDEDRHGDGADSRLTKLIRLLAGDGANQQTATVTEEELRSIAHHLDENRRSHADPRVIVKYLLYCCYDKNKKIKIPAVHSLMDVLEIDLDLLSDGMIVKMANDQVVNSSEQIRERMYSLMDKYIAQNPEKWEEYYPFFLRFLNDQSKSGRKICFNLLAKLIGEDISVKCKTMVFCKILELVPNEDVAVQRQVVDFCASLWFGGESVQLNNFHALLDIVDVPNACRHLRYIVEELHKASDDFPGAFRGIVRHILRNIEGNEKTLQCLQILSILVTLSPATFARYLSVIALPLNRSRFTDDNGVEILTAEILNCILPAVVNPDVLGFISLRSELVDRLKSAESLDYSMGLMASILKLLTNLSRFDAVYLYDNCFEPSLRTLRECIRTGKVDDNRIVNRALCVVIHLHVNRCGESGIEDFPSVLDHYIRHSAFRLTTIHCLCYLSLEYKLIMKNETVLSTVDKYLKDKRYPLLVKAVLYNILCSLKNIPKGQLASDEATAEGVMAVKSLIQKHMMDILDCIIDERNEIRETAYSVIRQLLVSAIVPEYRLIPSLLLMSTDPVDSLSQIGIEWLRKMQSKKLLDLSGNPSNFLIASLKFRSKCMKMIYVRGFRDRGCGIEAVCNSFYVLHQEEIMMRRRIIDSIMTELAPESETSICEKLYLADNLASFTYKYNEEVCYVLCQIEGASSVAAPDRIPTEESDRHVFTVKFYGLHILTFVKSYLMKCYGFNREKFKRYYQLDNKNDLAQRRVYVAYEIPEYVTPSHSDVGILTEAIHQALVRDATK